MRPITIKLVAGIAVLAGAGSLATTASATTFDAGVQAALDDAAGVSQLADQVLAGLPQPSMGGVTPGDISGGSGTDAVLGFINGGGSAITGITNRVLAGEELTPEQLAICEFLMRKGPSIDAWGDIMAVSDQIDVDLANAHLRELYPLGFQDSNGNFWKPNNEVGGWTRVTENPSGGSNVYRSVPSPPPFGYRRNPPSSPGDSSGSIHNLEPKPNPFD